MKHAGVLVLALAVCGCSSGLDGFYQQVNFASAPAGASVNLAWLDRGQPVPLLVDGSCTTPCSLTVARDRTYRATFSRPGCTPAEVRLQPVHNERFFVPIFPDGWTGRTYDLTPDPLTAALNCGTGA